MNVSYIERCNS